MDIFIINLKKRFSKKLNGLRRVLDHEAVLI